jgi:hypothetical protein
MSLSILPKSNSKWGKCYLILIVLIGLLSPACFLNLSSLAPVAEEDGRQHGSKSCKVCRKTFSSRHYYVFAHMSIHDKLKWDLCNFALRMQHTLEDHISKIHRLFIEKYWTITAPVLIVITAPVLHTEYRCMKKVFTKKWRTCNA